VHGAQAEPDEGQARFEESPTVLTNARTGPRISHREKQPCVADSSLPVAAPELRVLQLDAVSKRWRKTTAYVLKRISLDVPAASLIVIGGRNGAGKTTLLRLVAGVIVPDVGQVRMSGLSPTHDRRAYQREVSFVPSGNGGLHARLTVGQHLRYQSRLDLLPSDIGRRAIQREFERMRLAEFDGRRVDRLSMGQRQRLRLAMAMVRDPKVLLLDEPENSLDEPGILILHDLITDTTRRGGVVLWCSPTGQTSGPEPNQRYMLRDGKLIAL
jgi:ABC-2 type transport system ATP-binding protein